MSLPTWAMLWFCDSLSTSFPFCLYKLITYIHTPPHAMLFIFSFCQAFFMRGDSWAVEKMVPDTISHLTEHVSISARIPLAGSTKLSSIHLPLTQIVWLGGFVVWGFLLLSGFSLFLCVLFWVVYSPSFVLHPYFLFLRKDWGKHTYSIIVVSVTPNFRKLQF